MQGNTRGGRDAKVLRWLLDNLDVKDFSIRRQAARTRVNFEPICDGDPPLPDPPLPPTAK
jgi:hypothetical protein